MIIPSTVARVKTSDTFVSAPMAETKGEIAPAAPTRTLLQFAVGTTIPFIWGAQDAASGLACVPEMHWVRTSDQAEYAAGWASVEGHNDTTRMFLGSVN